MAQDFLLPGEFITMDSGWQVQNKGTHLCDKI